MKRRIKLFEDFKQNNIGGDLITSDDIINCIKNGGYIYATIIKNLPDNDPNTPLKPVSIDDDNSITIEYEGNEYEVSLENVKKIEI